MDAVISTRLAEARERSFWRPADPKLYGLFQSHREAHLRRSARVGLWVAVLAYIAFAWFDWLLLSDVAPMTAGIRIVVGLLAIAVIELQFRTDHRAMLMNATCALAVVIGATAWLAAALATEERESLRHYLVFGAIFMLGANLFFSFRPSIAIPAAGTVLVAFVAAALHIAPGDIPYLATHVMFLACCFALSSYLAWRLDRERFNVFVNETRARINEAEVAERGRELLRMANTDPLTGLRNRRATERAFKEMREAAVQAGAPLGVALFDVDFFKKYNDLFGHQKGDQCLIRVAQTIERTLEEAGGIAGRYGGEEFIAFCQVEDENELAALLERVRENVEGLLLSHPERKDGVAVVTVSAGASSTRELGSNTLERLANEADRALYRAKRQGRNGIAMFDAATCGADADTENVAALLRMARERDLVSLVYQPIVNVENGSLVAMETLMRLSDLDGEPVSPAVFIPIAEDTGAIVELGLWAIETACREIAATEKAPLVSVNISAVQLREPGFPLAVAAAVARSGARPGRLALEITESFDLALEPEARANIIGLQQFGVQVWLDDFGTGFAGLAGLRQIPFDMVKLDHCFLAGTDKPEGVAFLEDIIQLVRNCGFQIVVEGVETAEQIDLLRRVGMSIGQGYHLGRPAKIAANAEPRRTA